MFEFLIRKGVVKRTQKYVEELDPKVNLHIPPGLPLPSIRRLKVMAGVASQINAMETDMAALSEQQLKDKTPEFKRRYEEAVLKEKDIYFRLLETHRKTTDQAQKETLTLQMEKAEDDYRKIKKGALDDLLPEVFAVMRETGKRLMAMRHYDVQLIGGIILHNGDIAEMTTGEGKTLMATLAVYLNALTGEGAHVVTVNDYLAKRDMEWMGPLYTFHGLSIGVIQHDMDPKSRYAAYHCDVTYGTNNEFGFDYLRDNMVNFKEEMVQRAHHFAVVDEVDSILVDESRTPLIISGPAEESTDKYAKAYQVSLKLKGRRITEKDEVDAKHREEDLSIGYDYMADEKNKTISLTEEGEEHGAELFGIDNLHDMETIEYRHHILQALRAKEFFVNDIDYVVKDGSVMIVDEFTGRMMPGRRWSDGLHQAVEAREGIKIERENQTLATITFQNYFRMYEKLSGMTGTAYTEASEFKEIYDLDVVAVPTNKPLKRNNFPDSIYRSGREKFDAVVGDIEECNKRGQPVLVGTISIERSEYLANLLKQRGIQHQVLNAKFHEMEAHIISQAGRFEGVTIATNMAGRGTDIVLGGNAEYLAKNLAAQKASENNDPHEQETLTAKFIKQFEQQCTEEHTKVITEGGLHVIGTERHESRRIDNQLRGRQGRQGDPGSSRFYVSLEDDLMRLFGSERIMGLMDKLGVEEGQVLEHPWLSSSLENAQKKVEGHNFEIRKHLLEYDNVMNRQREVIYSLRRAVLESDNVQGLIIEAIEDVVDMVVAQYLLAEQDMKGWDLEGLAVYLMTTFQYDLFVEAGSKETLSALTVEDVKAKVLSGVKARYTAKEQEVGVDQLRYLERMLMLHTIDAKWKDHLYAMDQLKDSVGLRSYAQRDPLLEYKKEGFAMFEMMYGSISQEVAETIFKLKPSTGEHRMRGVFSSLPQKMVHDEVRSLSSAGSPPPASAVPGTGPAAPSAPSSSTPIQNEAPKVGRNDACPCGSGKKFKKCHGQ